MPFTPTVVLIIYAICQLVAWSFYLRDKKTLDRAYNDTHKVNTGVPSAGVVGAGIILSGFVCLFYTSLAAITGVFIV